MFERLIVYGVPGTAADVKIRREFKLPTGSAVRGAGLPSIDHQLWSKLFPT